MTALLNNSGGGGLGRSNPGFLFVKVGHLVPSELASAYDLSTGERPEEDTADYIRTLALPPIEQQIIEVTCLCRREDWDGYGAAAIPIGSARFLYQLLQKTPFTSFMTPEIGGGPRR
ncbi:MAG: hypothetical protein JJU03_04485 [Idiomarina sp.]|nr:hypothetical protein [Idiomarina sp.]